MADPAPIPSPEASLPSGAEAQAPVVNPPVDAAPAAPAPSEPHPIEVPSLLSEAAIPDVPKPETPEVKPEPAPEKVEAKVEEKAPEPEKKAVEAEAPKPEEIKEAPKTEEAKAPESIEYKFEFPETIKADVPEVAEFTNLLNEARVPPEAAQKMLNLHAKAMEGFVKEYQENVLRDQIKAFNDTRAGWRKEVLADPEIGGAGHKTAMGAIARMRDLFVPESERDSFNKMMDLTGAGDHPALLKAFHRAARYFDEGAIPPANPKPPPNLGVNPNLKGARVLYDRTKTSR